MPEDRILNIEKTIEYGTGLTVKYLDDKVIVCADNKMRMIEGNFKLEGDTIIIEAGNGIKISSRHPNVLVISSDTTKVDEKMHDLSKSIDERLKVIESVFAKILKSVKQ